MRKSKLYAVITWPICQSRPSIKTWVKGQILNTHLVLSYFLISVYLHDTRYSIYWIILKQITPLLRFIRTVDSLPSPKIATFLVSIYSRAKVGAPIPNCSTDLAVQQGNYVSSILRLTHGQVGIKANPLSSNAHLEIKIYDKFLLDWSKDSNRALGSISFTTLTSPLDCRWPSRRNTENHIRFYRIRSSPARVLANVLQSHRQKTPRYERPSSWNQLHASCKRSFP